MDALVSAFKKFASDVDEDGMRNLLRNAPRFLPTMESLARPGGAPRPLAAPPRPPSEAPSRRPSRPDSACSTSSSTSSGRREGGAVKAGQARPRRAGGPASGAGANSVRAQRHQRMQQLQAMYKGQGGARGADAAADAAVEGASTGAPARPSGLLLPSAVDSPQRAHASCAAAAPVAMGGHSAISSRAGSPARAASAPVPSGLRSPVPLSAEWEEEVDGLLDWAIGLAEPDLE